MNRKVYWGLGVLIVLLISVFAVMMAKKQAENRELEDQLAEAQKLADQIVEQKKLKNKPPVAREGYKMVQHGDHWHEVKIKELIETTVTNSVNSEKKDSMSWLEMSPEQLFEAFSKLRFAEKEFLDWQSKSPEQCVEAFLKMDEDLKKRFYDSYRDEQKRLEAYREKWGEDPPPIGANWQHIRNSNGETLKHYDNNITVLYTVGTGFAPTVEQWKKYEVLQAEVVEAERLSNFDEYDRKMAQLNKLIADNQGPVPIISGGFYSGDPISHNEESVQRLILQAQKKVYRKFGLEHLTTRSPTTSQTTSTVIPVQ